MRCAVGRPGEAFGMELPVEREHGGRFERRLPCHRWQQAGQASGQHRFARARRTDQQQGMCAGSGDLQYASGLCLTAHVGQIGQIIRR